MFDRRKFPLSSSRAAKTGYLPKGYVFPEELQFSGGFFFQTILPGMYFKENRYDTSLGTHFQRIRDMKVHSEQWEEVMKW
mmetsp:Transcript_6654/g.12996  ORF Transcript_6654/g.12996 Transcript_6654/m.12996 type:complete len:80 (-) Transcript_6654:88-327(-)